MDEPKQFSFSIWLRQAEAGDAASMFNVAECYSDGTEVNQNPKLAVIWYKRAADKGIVDAMLELGRCYCAGAGVPRDLTQAMHWLKKVYEADHMERLLPTPLRDAREKALRLLLLQD
ncbi:MAG: sel1 repeat family protein [Planctomycetes bacterium]|nr:sel1 repeat family protein [Planctomycetota bacterium]MBI3835142.1 sel1 repeat family protein [Planctomycetota bacterium]